MSREGERTKEGKKKQQEGEEEMFEACLKIAIERNSWEER